MHKGSYQVLRQEACEALPKLNEIALRTWASAASTPLMRVTGMQPSTKQGELFKPAFATRLVDTVTCFGGRLAGHLAWPVVCLPSGVFRRVCRGDVRAPLGLCPAGGWCGGAGQF